MKKQTTKKWDTAAIEYGALCEMWGYKVTSEISGLPYKSLKECFTHRGVRYKGPDISHMTNAKRAEHRVKAYEWHNANLGSGVRPAGIKIEPEKKPKQSKPKKEADIVGFDDVEIQQCPGFQGVRFAPDPGFVGDFMRQWNDLRGIK